MTLVHIIQGVLVYWCCCAGISHKRDTRRETKLSRVTDLLALINTYLSFVNVTAEW